MTEWVQWCKKIFFTGWIVGALGIITYIVQEQDITLASAVLLIIGYGCISVGGCGWLFNHSLNGFRQQDIIVTGDELAPRTRYTGVAARVFGLAGIVIALLLFGASLLPIYFLWYTR